MKDLGGLSATAYKTRMLRRSPAPRPPRPLALAGLPIPLEVRESARARKLSLRVDPGRGLILVVVPAGLADAEVRRFVGRHDAWLRERVAALPPPLPFADGAAVPLRGVDTVIRHDPSHRGGTGVEEGRIVVAGAPEFLARRVRDFLVNEARGAFIARAAAHASTLGVRVTGISVRDTRSRWGSCAANGRLNFSWRLILAPDAVLDYVVAHEVAHIREHNHSSRFWALCGELAGDVRGPRAWLKSNGQRLFRYGG